MSDAASVLVVDDDEAVGKVLAALLVQDGLRATWVGSAEAALATLEKKPYDLVLSDVRMPGFSGLELLKMTRLKWEDMPVILITAHGTVPMAVEAMREGAADFMLKPFQRDEVLYVVRKALTGSAEARAAPPRPLRAKVESTDGMVGTSPAVEEVRQLIRKIAPSTATALVLGETGTGKELAARALHSLSSRKGKPFVAVNCSAFTETLFESELFGHEPGAFTGAVGRKAGRIELAAGGTVLLDEIGELSPTLQVKLLRLIQEKTFERVGGGPTLKAEVRIVAATHRNLPEMVKAGTFREDLFYRLNVVPLTMPPLRDRPGDIEPLVRHFLAIFGPANGRPKAALTPGAMALLVAQEWPGNVRQLQNFVERLVVLAPEGDLIDEATVKLELERMGMNAKDAGTGGGGSVGGGGGTAGGGGGTTSGGGGSGTGGAAADTLPERRKDAERQAVEEALRKARGNRSVAARILGVSRRTLYNKLESLGLTEI